MQRSSMRTPRACERCRKSRRRCEPPYPCRQCVDRGVPCDVRDKARPHRQQPRRTARPSLSKNRAAHVSGTDGYQNPESIGAAQTNRPQPAGRPADTYELLKALVEDMLLERYGYKLNCALKEPPSCRAGGTGTSLLTPYHTSEWPPLTSAQAWSLLKSFRRFMGFKDARLVDIEELHATALEHLERLQTTSPSTIPSTVVRSRMPVDSVALVYSAFALGAVATGDFDQGRHYFGISTELVKHFVGQSTFNLCLAYFLQHLFALRSGTSNFAQGIMVQAIQIAMSLGLHQGCGGIQGLQLFLLIYMADQYCSLTHNTEPLIQSFKLDTDLFSPLKAADPELRNLIDLISINGKMIEKTHGAVSVPESVRDELETEIGTLCSRQIGGEPSVCGNFRAAYEPLARVHMLCCRMRLRAPSLSQQRSWLPSICICLHAAQSVLATYLELYQPVLQSIATQHDTSAASRQKLSTPAASKLAVTWRQVKRIMQSAFIVVLAYGRGEMVESEAARYVAMARLLLEFPRWRWGRHLNDAVQALMDIVGLTDLTIRSHMQSLLPGAGQHFLQELCDPQTGTAMVDQEGSIDEVYLGAESWPAMYAFASSEELSDLNIGTIEDQTLFGLWGNI